jgi:four helix bundle protein
MFTFERLVVYQRALGVVETVESLVATLKGRVSFSLLDQLSRATLSIPLNIAEGEGRWHKGEKRQFLRIARGSAFEIVPILQVLVKKQMLDEATHQRIYAELESISKMLIGLEKSVEALGAKTGSLSRET